MSRECITHHACDCITEKVLRVERENAELKSIIDALEETAAKNNVYDEHQRDEAKAKLSKAKEALEFYAVNWRCDVYVGPNLELIEDEGKFARQALKEIGGDE